MNRILLFATLVALAGGSTAGLAQTGMAPAPADGSTGPTVPLTPSSDTRQIDQSIANAPSSPASSVNTSPAGQADNWRSSSGLNADPNNPSGAPGPGTGLGTSPSR